MSEPPPGTSPDAHALSAMNKKDFNATMHSAGRATNHTNMARQTRRA